MKFKKLLAGALGTSLVLGALPGMAAAQDEPLALSPEGVEWTLTTLAGEPVTEGVEVTLFLSGGEVVGNAGCNSYFGSYELSEDSLVFPNPFGTTLKLCEDEVMAVEGQYLPLLQATIDWSINDEGALSLTDEDGVVQLVYNEAPIDITTSDVEALVAALGDLQAQIDAASAQVAAVAEETANIPVNRFDKRVQAVERRSENQGQRITDVERKTQNLNVQNLQRRISALEETVTRLDRTIDRFRDRIIALEEFDRAQEVRLRALEEEVFKATNLPS